MFAGDYDGQTPPGGKMTATQWDPTTATNSLMVDGKAIGYIENLALYMNVDVDTSSVASIEADLMQEEKMQGFICSAEQKGNVPGTYSVNLNPYRAFISKHSFATNDAMFSQENANTFNNKFSATPYPTKTVTVFDREVSFTATARLWASAARPTMLEWVLLGSANNWGKVASTDRHQGKMNVSFVDGHVGTVNNLTYAGLSEAYLTEGI